jgi:hypothetical protein
MPLTIAPMSVPPIVRMPPVKPVPPPTAVAMALSSSLTGGRTPQGLGSLRAEKARVQLGPVDVQRRYPAAYSSAHHGWSSPHSVLLVLQRRVCGWNSIIYDIAAREAYVMGMHEGGPVS